MITLGCDPGLFGSVVALDEDAKVIGFFDTPIAQFTKNKRNGTKSVKNDFAPSAMKDSLIGLIKPWEIPINTVSSSIHIWLEAAHARPGEGVSSSFKSGKGWGIWIGLITALGFPYTIVHPKTWTKVVLEGVQPGDPKQRSMFKAQQLFGSSLPLMKPRGRILSLDGRADAALIAYYGLLQSRTQI